MAYYTGTATSISDLITAINNAATANGWTKTATNNILYKGNVYAQLSESSYSYCPGLSCSLGTSQSADALVNPTSHGVGMTTSLYNDLGTSLSFPCTYHIFVNSSPDDIVVAVNYTSLYWQWLAFGQSTTIGITGSGAYCWGSCSMATDIGTQNSYLSFRSTPSSPTTYQTHPCFWGTGGVLNRSASFIRLEFDGINWGGNQLSLTNSPNAYAGQTQTYYTLYTLLFNQPNTWNNEAILVRTQIVFERASGFWSYVAELPHFRWLRNTYIDDGTILTLGADDWFVAPIHKKNLAVPTGWPGGLDTHSGTYGFAVRKT